MLPQFFADEAAERCSGQPEPLVQVLPEWCDQTGGLYLVYPTTRHIPAKVQAFRDFVVRWFADKPGGVGGA
jgi:DNA-binding transcriptional LysR family regulator